MEWFLAVNHVKTKPMGWVFHRDGQYNTSEQNVSILLYRYFTLFQDGVTFSDVEVLTYWGGEYWKTTLNLVTGPSPRSQNVPEKVVKVWRANFPRAQSVPALLISARTPYLISISAMSRPEYGVFYIYALKVTQNNKLSVRWQRKMPKGIL